MFAVQPYSAEYEEIKSDKAGNITMTWKPCRVLGVQAGEDGPQYVVEIYSNGSVASLITVGYVRVKP